MAGTERKHETRDVSMRWMVISGVILVLLLIAAFVTMRWTFDLFEAREARRQSEPATLVSDPGPGRPPEPRLQANPRLELQEMRAEENEVLQSYGWVDRDQGVARMPIDEAMKIVVQRGLPARDSGAGRAGGGK
jgi:hypothetical protein